MTDVDFYGPELAAIHHDGFGDIAGDAVDPAERAPGPVLVAPG